jgi:hypothetical protein
MENPLLLLLHARKLRGSGKDFPKTRATDEDMLNRQKLSIQNFSHF